MKENKDFQLPKCDPLEDRWYAVDVETTGLDPDQHRVISLAAAEVEGGKLTGREWQNWYAPEGVDSDEGAFRTHGLTVEFLMEKAQGQTFNDRLPDFWAFVTAGEGRPVLMAHNAPFDAGFIDAECRRAERAGVLSGHVSWVDTLDHIKQHYPSGGPKRRGQYSLDALLLRHGFEARTGAHEALGDARMLAKLMLHLFRQGPALGSGPSPTPRMEIPTTSRDIQKPGPDPETETRPRIAWVAP